MRSSAESVAAPIEFEIDTYENKDETNPIKRATEMFLAQISGKAAEFNSRICSGTRLTNPPDNVYNKCD